MGHSIAASNPDPRLSQMKQLPRGRHPPPPSAASQLREGRGRPGPPPGNSPLCPPGFCPSPTLRSAPLHSTPLPTPLHSTCLTSLQSHCCPERLVGMGHQLSMVPLTVTVTPPHQRPRIRGVGWRAGESHSEGGFCQPQFRVRGAQEAVLQNPTTCLFLVLLGNKLRHVISQSNRN